MCTRTESDLVASYLQGYFLYRVGIENAVEKCKVQGQRKVPRKVPCSGGSVDHASQSV